MIGKQFFFIRKPKRLYILTIEVDTTMTLKQEKSFTSDIFKLSCLCKKRLMAIITPGQNGRVIVPQIVKKKQVHTEHVISLKLYSKINKNQTNSEQGN